MPEHRIYKKFPNRRLYGPIAHATIAANYVTLTDIAQFIQAGGTVKVLDHTSKKDITPEELTKILLSLSTAAFTVEQLHSHIRQAY